MQDRNVPPEEETSGKPVPSGNHGNLNKLTKNRPIPREYFKVLADTCTLSDWKEITETAVGQAKQGNDRARLFLSKHLLPEGMTIMDLAKLEYLGISKETSIENYHGPIVNPKK